MVRIGSLDSGVKASEETLLYQNKTFLAKSTPTGEDLYDYFAITTTSGTMVGANGTILRYNPATYEFEIDPASGVVTTEFLLGVSFCDANNGVAVGFNCAILGWDGVEWTQAGDYGMLPDVDLYGVYHFGSFLIACGWDTVTNEGVILHKGWYIDPVLGYLEHANWTEVYRSSDIKVRDIDAYTIFNILCAGSSGKYVETADWGNTWSAVKQTPAEGDIMALGFVGSDFGFGVTLLGEIIKWDGTSWTLLSSPTSIGLHDVMLFSKDFALAVGNGGIILAWNGTFWHEYPSPTGLPLNAIFGISANFCWICGQAGYIGQFQSSTFPSLLIDSAGNAIGYANPLHARILNVADETQIFEDEEIRDTDPLNSDIGACSRFNVITVWVENGLDQNVSVQIKGNRVNSVTGAVNIGTAFDVATVDREARTMEPVDEGFLPYIFIEVTAAGIPTDGDLNAYLIKKPI